MFCQDWLINYRWIFFVLVNLLAILPKTVFRCLFSFAICILCMQINPDEAYCEKSFLQELKRY